MNFRWVQEDNKHYLYFGKFLVAFKVVEHDKFVSIYCMLTDNIFGLDNVNLYDVGIESAKKSVEDLIRNFCVDFNIWYMR